VAEVSNKPQKARFAESRQRVARSAGHIGVRALPLAVVISAGLNASAVAWVATRPVDDVPVAPQRAVPAPTPEPSHDQIVPPVDETYDVAFVDPVQMAELERLQVTEQPPVQPPVQPTEHAHADVHAHDSKIAATTAHSSEQPAGTGATENPGTEAPGSGSGSSLLHMRGPEISKPMSAEWMAKFMANTKPAQLDPEPSGELAPSGNGTFESNQGPFTMHVARDGSVKFEDAPNVSVHVALPSPKKLGKGIASWYEDPAKGAEEGSKVVRSGDYKAMGADDKADTAPVAIVPVLSGGFDATDALMRSHGQDPYFSRKLKVLDATRDERAAMRGKYDRDQLKRASEIAQAHLDRLWASSLDIAARKQALFELWDECAESGSADLITAGSRARAQIVGFIRAKLPEGSPDAFTTDEVARLDAHRRSTAHFAPY
jgi:hypothetical protein